MSPKTATPQPPTGWSRFLYRLPIWLYRARLGWLLDKRFLLLQHTGRKSGLARETVLEVTNHDREGSSYIVASAWGAKSDWYRNVQHTPQVTIHVGRDRLDMTAELLSPEQSGEAMVSYARRYPTAARALVRLIGYQVDGTEQAYRELGQEKIPFVRFGPR
jgi:deazaflavin-dependent oxidoreductase (nitroreductase family)